MAKGAVIVVDRVMLLSEVFRGLSSTAKNVLFDFLMMRKMVKQKSTRGSKTVCVNNGELQYCYDTALKKGIPKQTFKRAIDQLIERGFIDIAHHGSGGRKGDKSLYSVVENWRKWGTDEFTCKPRKKNTKEGIGFAVVHQRNGTSKKQT